MARSLARELLPRGSGDTPMQRLGRPEEVAKALVFSAFEATYTTGAELAVDGGGSQP